MNHKKLNTMVTHLNAPYGNLVKPADVINVLRSGKEGLVKKSPSSAILMWMFVECKPSLIEKVCAEVGLPTQNALLCYQSFLDAGAPPVPEWELKNSMNKLLRIGVPV